jgi:hypothetical protein
MREILGKWSKIRSRTLPRGRAKHLAGLIDGPLSKMAREPQKSRSNASVAFVMSSGVALVAIVPAASVMAMQTSSCFTR